MTGHPGRLKRTPSLVFYNHPRFLQNSTQEEPSIQLATERFETESKPLDWLSGSLETPHGSPSRLPASESEPTILTNALLSPVGAIIRGSSIDLAPLILAEQQSG